MPQTRNRYIFAITVIILFLIASTSNTAFAGYYYQTEDESGTVFLPIIDRDRRPVPSDISGKIFDARTDTEIAGASVCLDNLDICMLTAEDGEFLFYDVTVGNHILYISADGFVDSEMDVEAYKNSRTRQDIHLFPQLDGGELRIQIFWDTTETWPPDETPNDLNLHLWTPFTETEYQHIFYANPGACDDINQPPFVCVEEEIQFGGGPESIVISRGIPGSYQFGVVNENQHLPGVPDIKTLSVRAVLNWGTGESHVVELTATDPGDFWYIFDINDFDDEQDVTDQNCITYYSDDPPQCGVRKLIR